MQKTDGDYLGYVMSQPVSKPSAPINLTAALLSKNQIDLGWVINADNYSKLRVERKTGTGAAYSLLGIVDEFEQTFSDITVFSANTTYTYRVTAYESDTSLSASNEYSISTAVPSAPTGLSLVKESGTKISLSWNDNSSSEAGFCVERRDDSGEFVLVAANVQYNTKTYTDTVEASHTYTYRVYARSPFGNSAYSNEVTASKDSLILAPSALSITAASASQLDLAWSYAGTGSYSTVIDRKTGADGSWITIYTSASGVLKYSDTNLSANVQYFYKVRNVISTGVYSLPYPNNDSGVGAYTMLGGLPLSGCCCTLKQDSAFMVG